jgi:hypothetical protein
MANLSEHAYGYSAVNDKEKTQEEREISLDRDYARNMASHKKTKVQLLYCIAAVYVYFFLIEWFGYSDFWFLGVVLMNIFAVNYGGYAYYEIIERSHYMRALRDLEREIEDGE